jgi:excisionase family DNA binding protein
VTPKNRQNERRYLSIEEAAAYVSVSAQTIRRHIDSGQLPAHRFGKKLVRILQADLDAMMRRIPAVGQ